MTKDTMIRILLLAGLLASSLGLMARSAASDNCNMAMPMPPGPANDNCSGATLLTVSSGTSCTTTNVSWSSASASGGTPTPACGSYSTGDVWFRVVVPALGQLVITTSAGSITDGAMALYTGTCASLTEIACSDDAIGTMPQIIQTTGLTPGATVYIRVWDYYDATSGNIGICVADNVPPPPANDNCSGGVALTMQTLCSSTTSGSTSGATSSMAASACGGTSDDDVWYTFTTAAAQTTATIQVSGGTIDAVVEVFSGACGSTTSIGCMNSSSTAGRMESLTLTGLTGSTTYRVRVYSGTGTAGSFNIVALNNPNFSMVDDATSVTPFNCSTLTPAANDMRGCVWDINSNLNFGANFSYDYTINMGSNDAGADGMAFVIQNDPLGKCKCGTAGGALGAGGIANSLIVEIDTYLNTEDRDDGIAGVTCSGGPEPDHLDIWLNGNVNPELGSSCVTDAGERVVPNAVALMNGATAYNIENGANHILRIAWNAGSTTLTVTILNSAGSVTYGTISYSFSPMTVFGTTTPNFGFTASTGGLNNNQSICFPNALLPIELGQLTAQCNKGTAELEWNTLSETMNSHFTVERSADGIHFETISVIAGAGTSSYAHHYALEDKNPFVPYSYYRIKQTDFNGAVHEMGTIKEVTRCNETNYTVNVLPNPATGPVSVVINDLLEEEDFTISVTDVSGKLIATQKMHATAGNNSLVLPIDQKGMYLVNVSSVNDVTGTTYKVIVQ